jgi:uncharacterized protein
MTTQEDARAPTVTTEPVRLTWSQDHTWAWSREPVMWSDAIGTVRWQSPGGSDFWRITEGVRSAYDGSALLARVQGDFECDIAVRGEFNALYDQVGLMIASSETRWLKAGLEDDGNVWLSAVHTRTESDWSRERWAGLEVRLRVRRHDGTVEISVEEASGWRVFRTAYLDGVVGVGPYSCSPKGDGFIASVSALTLRG